MKYSRYLSVILSAVLLYACTPNETTISISSESGTNNCLMLKDIVNEHSIDNIVTYRPLGKSTDTTVYSLDSMTHLYGERLFTLGDEKFECRNIDSIIHVVNNDLVVTYKKPGYNTSGPFTQEYVTNYWELGNGFLLDKELPTFSGSIYKSVDKDLEEVISQSEKTLLHFGWLNCQGCLKEQKLITKLKGEHPDITFVNITIDNIETLDKYLIDRGDYFETKEPYNKLSDRINKPLYVEEKNTLLELFKLKGLFPVNFLIDKSGRVEKIGPVIQIFDHNNEIKFFKI